MTLGKGILEVEVGKWAQEHIPLGKVEWGKGALDRGGDRGITGKRDYI